MQAQRFSIGAYGVPTRYREVVLTLSNNGLLEQKFNGEAQRPWAAEAVEGRKASAGKTAATHRG